MSSPFLRNRTRRLAIKAGLAVATATIAAPDETTGAGQEYAALKVRLHDQLRQLADVDSHEARQPMKAKFAGDYRDWLGGVIEADQPVQDEILLTNMVWAIDYGDFARAVWLGAFALKHGLAMPERYKRSVACFLREDIAEAALANPDAVDLELLAKIDELTAGADMPDAAKAKLHKALGRAWRVKADAFEASDDSAPAGGKAAYVQAALDQMQRAVTLDRKSGVKKDIEQMERQLRDLAPPTDPDTTNDAKDAKVAEQPSAAPANPAQKPTTKAAPRKRAARRARAKAAN
ncbi:Phage terminase, endonuclease subunit [Qipengyuania citrea LAMA 915]|uniref:Phage terminase, endonuclease subunit n=1 Tax=Qipengyuania citrea LAMA 915 TaxID=1306953 RepID=A0A0L1KFG1_9SPHN|nr:phage terminase small subunit [Qipengyuania citrea]KNH02609.1 Phage terminase, endonuclease subunit [Qipengyuania citrea LAMA 915]